MFFCCIITTEEHGTSTILLNEVIRFSTAEVLVMMLVVMHGRHHLYCYYAVQENKDIKVLYMKCDWGLWGTRQAPWATSSNVSSDDGIDYNIIIK